jgi:hypothetical protein
MACSTARLAHLQKLGESRINRVPLQCACGEIIFVVPSKAKILKRCPTCAKKRFKGFVVCPICGKMYKGQNKTCGSPICVSEAISRSAKLRTGEKNPFYGKSPTTEHREKISIKLSKGIRIKTCSWCGKQFETNGWVDHRRNYCSEECISENRAALNYEMFGEYHPNYHNGESRKPYPLGFDKYIKGHIGRRDNYTCTLCQKYSKLVHHIDYNKDNLDESNLIILCHSCNSKVNFNRGYWEEFLVDVISMKYQFDAILKSPSPFLVTIISL